MATYLPTSGALSMSSINSVFGGRGDNLNSYRGTTYYLSTGGAHTFSSGAIGFGCFYGTGPSPNSFTYTVASNQTNFCMRAGAVSAGWCQSAALNVVINSGVIISSNGTGTPAMTIQGSYPSGVSVKNNGTIVGMGGAGGKGGGSQGSGAGGVTGGTALKISSSVTFCNASGTIAGGGGGGGGGGTGSFFCCGCVGWYPGGGGGGGRSSNAANSSGGSGGCHTCPSWVAGSGSAGTYSSAGGGGASGCGAPRGGHGGSGGNWGASGSGGCNGAAGNGGSTRPPGGGGAGGKATCGASNVTWTATGTRYGSIS